VPGVNEAETPSRFLAISVLVMVIGGSVVLLVAGLRGVMLTDAAEAVVTSDARNSCKMEPCFRAEVEFVTASGEIVVTEASVAKEARPGDTVEVHYYRDDPTDLSSGGWLMVASGAAPVGIGILIFLGLSVARFLRWFKSRRYTRVTHLDDRLPL